MLDHLSLLSVDVKYKDKALWVSEKLKPKKKGKKKGGGKRVKVKAAARIQRSSTFALIA
jgi:hypothetical protein